MSASDVTFSKDAYKTNELIWGMFMTSSMKAAIHLGPNYKSNSEIYFYTKLEDIESVCNITQQLVREHSEEILNVKFLEYSSSSWTRSVLANDQAIKWAKAKVCVYADSVLCLGQMNDTPEAVRKQDAEGQVEGPRSSGHRWRIRVACFPWIFVIVYSSRNPYKTWRERKIQPEEFKDWIIFTSMFTVTLSGKRVMKIVFRMPRKSRITQCDSRKGVGRSCARGRKRSGTEVLPHAQKGQCVFNRPTKTWWERTSEPEEFKDQIIFMFTCINDT